MGDKSVVRCRACGQEHWTTKCPWKDTVLAGGKLPDDKKGGPAPSSGKFQYIVVNFTLLSLNKTKLSTSEIYIDPELLNYSHIAGI